jgi:hypothetical protein
MAEIKNSFLGSRMNKDVDDRLLPSNEYRDAINISVSESEDSDVGAVENVIGTAEAAAYTGIPNAKVIGSIADEKNDNIYLFFTNFTDGSGTALDLRPVDTASDKTCAIVVYNTFGSTFTELVKGSFLNFSTTHEIFGLNLIENLLFWTDNRNQPRKINVDTALASGTYYTSEDHISVAKYAPFRPINLYKETSQNPSVYETTMKDVVSLSKIDGKTGIVKANVTNSSSVTITQSYGFDFAQNDIISFGEDSGATEYTVTSFTASSGLLVFSGGTVTLVKGTPIVNKRNTNFIKNYSGDPKFLEDKFVRFSYRFKFDDNEYSIIAPFTQAAYIPKQDGYFLGGDEMQTEISSEVSFMVNKVNFIELMVPLPEGATLGTLVDNQKIKEIDILYKESDSLAIKVVDTVTIDKIQSSGSANSTFYQYDYQATKPILVLPSSETTRAYDKTPVKALAQEVTGNRVIYGNYVDKHTAPDHLSYKVTATPKLESGDAYTGIKDELPQHTLKRNRNYQVGFVLSDRFGRQSDVILSNVLSTSTSVEGIYGASTIYFPNRGFISAKEVEDDLGNSLKILFEEPITSNFSPLVPGLVNQTGEPGLYDATTNPTGWYSYKVVVKQLEQEYYNVYVPGIINGALTSNSPDPTFAFTTLLSDNINKVPKELSDTSSNQLQFNSEEKLFCVVDTPAGNFNKQSFTDGRNSVVTTIATFSDMGGNTGSPHANILQAETNPFIAKLQTPFGIGKPHTSTDNSITLGVFETAPKVSSIDIYYETSTVGLISELNTEVFSSSGPFVAGFSFDGYDHQESQDPSGSLSGGTGAADSPWVTDRFAAQDSALNNLPSSEVTYFEARSNSDTVQRAKYINGIAQSGTQDFQLITENINSVDYHRIKILNPFYFGVDASVAETYTFRFKVRNSELDCAASVNGAVPGINVINVDAITANKTLYEGMQVLQGATIIGTITRIFSQSNQTAGFELSASVTLADDDALTFKAIESDLFWSSRSLSNSSPTAGTYTYVHNPAYSTMPGIFANNSGAKNGSFDTTRDTLDLTWDFDPVQAGVSAILAYSFSTYLGNPLITITSGQSPQPGDSLTLSIESSTGRVSKFAGRGWRDDIRATVRVTDSGGATDSITLDFDMKPGGFTDAFSLGFDI